MEETTPHDRDVAFASFQRTYLRVYWLLMFTDWIQGPYVYVLYEYYGFTMQEIGQLFIAGYGTAALFAMLVGWAADVIGRRRVVLVYALLGSVSCLTKHSHDFHMLLMGRVAAGIASSILHSAPDAWMVHEHKARKFPMSHISTTFARASVGNSLVAILSGLIGASVVSLNGVTAAFDAAAVGCCFVAFLVVVTWNENFGTHSIYEHSVEMKVEKRGLEGEEGEERVKSIATGDDQNSCENIPNFGLTEDLELAASKVLAVKCIALDVKLILLCLLQCLFEGSMYIFVFLWTPSLHSRINHGLIFSILMFAVCGGSRLFALAESAHLSSYDLSRKVCFLSVVFVCGGIALEFAQYFDSFEIRLCSFVAFEFCCGMYFPCFHTIRSCLVPDVGRATLTAAFRLPLNLIVVAFLACVRDVSLSYFLGFGAMMQMLGCVVCMGLCWLVMRKNNDDDMIPHTEILSI